MFETGVRPGRSHEAPGDFARAGRDALDVAQPTVDFGFGLVTYLWGADWDLPTLLANCLAAGYQAVELRTTHAHGVEPALDDNQRRDVARQFDDAGLTLVGLGSNEWLDHPDPADLQRAIETIQAFVRLSHDVGGSGVKIKPDRFHPNVPHEQTIEQIGRCLRELAAFGEGFGQELRLEVHGTCAPLDVIAQIMQVADHPNAVVCWNSEPTDLADEGLAANFARVADRLGHTCHVRQLDDPQYPYAQLFGLLARARYDGWVLLEAHSQPAADPGKRLAALRHQADLFKSLAQQATR
jgi:sugar phosphate isomerase/epimerase